MNSYRDDYRSAHKDTMWTMPRAILLGLAAVASVFLLLVLITPLTIGFGWISGEANLRSFGHVRQTYAYAYDHIAALQSLQQNACVANQAISEETDPAIKSQRRTQLIAVENTYNRTQREYDAYMSDHFRGKVIKPGDLPLPAPSLDLSSC